MVGDSKALGTGHMTTSEIDGTPHEAGESGTTAVADPPARTRSRAGTRAAGRPITRTADRRLPLNRTTRPTGPRAVARLREPGGRRPHPGPWLIAAGAFVLYALLSVLRYERRDTGSWDLGIFTQAVRNYAHFRAPMVEIRGHALNLLGDHFHPILALLGPFFAVFPSPITLLLAQAFLLAVAAVPITKTAMELLGKRQGYAIGAAYGLSWGIVQCANFDFHEVCFAVPLLAFSLCAYLKDEYRKTILWALPLLFVKEDLALLVPIIIAMVVARRNLKGRLVAQGVAIGCGIACGALAMALLVKIVIPHFNPDGVYLYWNDGGCLDPKQHKGLGQLMTCVPAQFFHGIGLKERTVLMTLLPVAFTAVRSPLVLLTVPALLARFINVTPSYWGTDFHYSAVPMVIVFVAGIHGLVLMKRSREDVVARPQTWLRSLGDAQLRHGAVAILAIGAALSQSFPLQDLWQSHTWFPDERAAAIKKAERMVPNDVTVETTVAMLPELAARTDAMWIGNPNSIEPPDYVAFDIDRSGWNGQPTAADFVHQRHGSVTYTQLYADTKNNVYVFKRTG